MEDTEFHFSKLSNVKFENCEFEGTEFKGVEFNHVSFSHCKMENVSFDFAQLNEVCFTECFLDGSEFDFSSGTASFSSCSMGCTEFPMAAIELTFTKCNLHHAELNGILNLRLHAKETDFSRAEFNNSIMEGSAENCIFSNSEFYGTNGKKLQFTGCRFHNISTEGSVGIEENEEINDEFDVDEELEELFNE